MMLTQRHLRYESIRAWLKAEKIPCPITAIRDRRRRDRCLKEFSELRDALYQRHVSSLSEEERRQIASGTHPSQKSEFPDAAGQYARDLAQELKSMGCDCEVTVDTRQGGRLGLGVQLCPTEHPVDVDSLPEFYHGFEVAYFTPGI